MPELWDDASERTYPPTPLRLEEARRNGQVPRSGDLAGSAVLTGGVAVLGLLGPRLLDALTGMTVVLLDGRDGPTGELPSAAFVWRSVASLIGAVATLLAVLVTLAVLVNIAQVGMLATPVKADWRRVGLGAGFRRIFSVRSLARTCMAMGKLLLVGVVAWITIRAFLPQTAAAGELDARGLVVEAGACVYELGLRLSLALLAMGAVDWLYQRWQHNRDLRMTRREWLDDLRSMEGSGRQLRRSAGAAGTEVSKQVSSV